MLPPTSLGGIKKLSPAEFITPLNISVAHACKYGFKAKHEANVFWKAWVKLRTFSFRKRLLIY